MNKNWMVVSSCVGMLVLAVLASSCSQTGDELTGRLWALTELGGQPPVAGTGISAQFTEDGQVSGSAGCNRYSGTFTASGKDITFSPMALTMMMCEPAVMEQESTYLQALDAARTFEVNSDQLTLAGEDGTQLAVYQAQSQDLVGTNWEATAFNNGQQAVIGLLAETALTASFSEDGTISGDSGCNSFTGSYEVDGGQITIGPLASSMRMCDSPAGVMDQEAQFLAALESAASYQIEGDVLELRTADDALAALFTRK